MALHGPPPGVAGVQARVVGLGSDGGGIEQGFGAHQGHGAGGLRIPLVPADPDAELAGLGVPHAKARVAGAEIVLLLIAGPVGDVALAIDAEQRAVRVGHHQAVVVVRPVALEDRDRDHHPQLRRQRRQGRHAGVLAPGIGGLEPALLLADAEVRPLEQFGRQHHLRALRPAACRVSSATFADIGGHVLAEGGLDHGEGEGAGHQAGSCWVMQWNDPPPVRIARAGRPITSRPGNRPARTRTAMAPAASP